MESIDQIKTVRFHNVEFNTHEVSLLDQQSKIATVLKNDIREIVLKYGYQSERPLIQVVFGIGLLLIGLYFIVNFILHIFINRIVYTTMLLSIILFPAGIWFMVDGFRKRLYFEVTLENNKRKFPLGKDPDKQDLDKFIKKASQLGYSIDTTILRK